jgi:uncharacterized membrane protein (UPF0127 family)
MTCIKLPSLPRRAAAALGAFAGALGAALALLAPLPASAQTGPQPRLPTINLTAGIHVIKTELAITGEQQMVGMMFRKEMGTNDGMLFVNDEPGVRCFWMRNTLLPLSIAFIADDGTIVNIADMDAKSDKSHCSAKPVRFALEMNRGWFAKRGIAAGAKLQGQPFGNR